MAQENLANIHEHIYSEKFINFRSSVEGDLDIDHYQYMMHPQMASNHYNRHHIPDYSFSSHYNYDYNYEHSSGNSKYNRQHRPKPNYPHAYGSESAGFNRNSGKKNAVPQEEIEKRILNEGKKRVLSEKSDNLNEKKYEIETNYRKVIYGNEQISKTFWMVNLENSFENSKKNFLFVSKLSNELLNLGINIEEIGNEIKNNNNSTFEFHVMEYIKDLDSEYVPDIKMFVPYLAIN